MTIKLSPIVKKTVDELPSECLVIANLEIKFNELCSADFLWKWIGHR